VLPFFRVSIIASSAKTKVAGKDTKNGQLIAQMCCYLTEFSLVENNYRQTGHYLFFDMSLQAVLYCIHLYGFKRNLLPRSVIDP